MVGARLITVPWAPAVVCHYILFVFLCVSIYLFTRRSFSLYAILLHFCLSYNAISNNIGYFPIRFLRTFLKNVYTKKNYVGPALGIRQPSPTKLFITLYASSLDLYLNKKELLKEQNVFLMKLLSSRPKSIRYIFTYKSCVAPHVCILMRNIPG
uniref:Uncharacterized protein n=1 Tax=Heterorhabditis bacteriophora TaxID=37862 RepID=A0A1I7WA57_HETBA